MNSQRVTITYNAPPTFLASEHWKQVYAALLSQLPLRNLHWKSASRPAIQTIQELEVNFVSAEAKRDEHTSQIPQTVLEKPLLNLYFVVCDVSVVHYCLPHIASPPSKDSETYRSSVKKQIKDWHTGVSQKKNQEWLIVHIVKPDSKTAAARMFQIKASVLGKLKADFNVEKRDRCAKFIYS